jgi:hypothetical protein
LFQSGHFVESESAAGVIMEAYYSDLGLTTATVLAVNPDVLWSRLPLAEGGDRTEAQATLKRVADSLDLLAQSRVAQGRHPQLARLHAHKFFVMADASSSAMRLGIEVAWDFLLGAGDPAGAVWFAETALIPNVEDGRFLDWLVPVRTVYAASLAYAGRIDEAVKILESVSAFVHAPDSRDTVAFEMARDHIRQAKRLAGRALQPAYRIEATTRATGDWAAAAIIAQKGDVGRNDPCPCGSGKKYKKCHGHLAQTPKLL